MARSQATDNAPYMTKRTHMYSDSTTTETATRAAVSAVDISKTYGEGEAAVKALCTVSIDAATGECLPSMAQSGSVKSTLIHLLAGLDCPTEGNVYIDGDNVTRMK